ncbi:MAG: hypothetical protein RMJ98_14835 [Myxococcales bacterium]|nr:hypothetical protein [Polyangiaceae bacterium]MDW8250568.1 hypothetical protein [Myxococcales bacterium]
MNSYRFTIFLALLLLALSLGCEDKNASEMVLLFSSDTSVGDGQIPPEIGFLELSGSRAGNDFFVQFPVSRNGGLTAFPASLVLYNATGSDPETIGSLTIRGFRSDADMSNPLLIHSFSFNLAKEESRLLRIPLQLSCFGVLCAGGQTCIDGVCVGPVSIDAATLPLYSAQADPSKNRTACLDVRRSAPCFSEAYQVSASAVLPDLTNTQRCLFRVAASLVPADQEERLNLAAVWVESSGRYALLDRIPDKDPATPWRTTNGSWTFNRTLGPGAFFEFRLPEGICKHTPIGQTGRIKNFVFSTGKDTNCPAKTPLVEVCDHFPKETFAEPGTCVEPLLAEDIVGPQCTLCVRSRVPIASSACQNDTGCEQILSCILACRALGKSQDCMSQCARQDACISAKSVNLAKTIGSKIVEAVDQCVAQGTCAL